MALGIEKFASFLANQPRSTSFPLFCG